LERFFESKYSSQSGKAADKTFATKLADKIKKSLNKKRIVLQGPEDLPALGIDPESNAAVATVKDGNNSFFVWVVPLMDAEKFKEALAKYQGSQVETVPKDDSPHHHLFKSGNLYLGLGGDKTALLSNDAKLLQRILDTQDQNLAYFRSSDRLVRGFAGLVPGGQGASESWLRGSVNIADSSAYLIQGVQFVFSMDSRQALFRARLVLQGGRSELAVRLLTEPQVENSLADQVLRRSNGAAVLADDSLSYVLRYLSSNAAAEELAGFNAMFPGLLDELHMTASLRQMSVAASEENEQVPGIILGLRMSSEEAEKLVFHLQSSLRLKRDQEILRAAAELYGKTAHTAGQTPIGVLLGGWFLSDERDPLWSRYVFKGDEAVLNPALSHQDFANSTYRKEQAQFVLQYILPPVTDDDIAYRLQEAENVDYKELKQDKYRLCSCYFGQTLWLGNDADVLYRWLNLLRRPDAGANYSDATAYTKDARRAKLILLVRPRELLDSGQLYPDPEVNKQTHLFLSDVSQYQVLLVWASTNVTEREVYVSANLFF
jgi:hypothetical protein